MPEIYQRYFPLLQDGRNCKNWRTCNKSTKGLKASSDLGRWMAVVSVDFPTGGFPIIKYGSSESSCRNLNNDADYVRDWQGWSWLGLGLWKYYIATWCSCCPWPCDLQRGEHCQNQGCQPFQEWPSSQRWQLWVVWRTQSVSGTAWCFPDNIIVMQDLVLCGYNWHTLSGSWR